MASFLKELSAYAAPLLQLLSPALLGGAPSCRCYPGDECWPSTAEWAALNASIGGALVETVPLASPCYSSWPTFNQAECDRLRDNWYLAETHLDSPSSVMAPWFRNHSCDVWGTSPEADCIVGSMVQYTVNATTAAAFKTAVAFTKKHNIRLTIRNSGHDYLAKSSGPGAVSLWTHWLRDIEFVDYASPHYTGKAVKVGAGVYNGDVAKAAREHGYAVVGGNCYTIALPGGFSQGGGHSPLTTKHGLGADQVLEWDVMTSDGELLTATPEKNADLYWALSGGGGGTYALVLSATLRVHPDAQTSGATLSFSGADLPKEKYWGAIQSYLAQVPSMIAKGAVSYFMILGPTFLVLPTIAMDSTKEDIDELFAPILEHLQANNIQHTYASSSHAAYWTAWENLMAPNNVSGAQMGSRILPASLLQNDLSSVVNAYSNIVDKGGVIVGIAMDASIKAGAVPNSVHPVWREPIVNTVMGTIWSETDRQRNLDNQRVMTEEMVTELSRLTPGGGTYMNEADFLEPNFQEVFYGPNYKKLRQIKAKYDPDDVWYARTAVGSDEWVEKADGRLCKVGSAWERRVRSEL